MKTSPLISMAVAMLIILDSCRPSPDQGSQTVEKNSVAGSISTQAEARAAVALYLREQPEAALYQLDSARVVDVRTHWQVLVPRTDWAQRMPNSAAFEVDKRTGQVTQLRVK